MHRLLKPLIPLLCVLAPLAQAQDEFSTSAAPEEESAPATAVPDERSDAADAGTAEADAGSDSQSAADTAASDAATLAPVAEAEAADSATTTQTTTVVTEETIVTEVTQTPAGEGLGAVAVTDYVAALGHYYWLDKDWDAEDAVGVQVLRGWNLGGRWFAETGFLVNLTENDTDVTDELNQYGASLDFVRMFGDRSRLTPFMLLGGAVVYNDVFGDGRDDYGAQFNAGLGLVTGPLTESGLRLRTEGRFLHNTYRNDRNDYRASVGLEYALPGAPEALVPPPVAEAPVQVVSTEIADSDGDGVADPYDACPDTPQGMEVDGRGCALPQVLTITGVVFEFDSARLTSDGRKILDEVAKKIIAYKNIPMELAGHTDSVGDDDYNQKLSDLRANSVREYLVAQGVSGAGLTAKSYGESQPVADNDTAAGRQLNRRVELRIEGQK